jgi:DNA-binding SARP family transcriptional activator
MLRLRTFGGLTLERDGVRLDEIVAQRKVLALLAVLARSGQGGIGRERLMALLWADSDMERARGSLKQMLHTLRRQLAPDVVIGTSELQLNRQVVSSDVADFSDSIDQGELEQGVQLYRGPFLDGVHVERAPDFSRWQDAERAELQRSYMDALETLARAAEGDGRYDEAVAWWLRFSAADPLRARGVIGLMTALDLAGDRAGAMRHAQIHEDLLREELGAKPDPDVAALAAQMRASPGETHTPQPVRTVNSEPIGSSAGIAHEAAGVTGGGISRSPEISSAAPRDRREPTHRRGRWALAAALAVALLAAALIPGGRDRPDAAVTADSKRIVVAMFANQTGDSTLDGLQLLAADWMTRGVASAPGVDVLYPGVLYAQGREASGAPTSPLELARNNGAQLAIAGNYYRSRDTLFFAASLVEVPTGRVVRVLGPFPARFSAPLDGIEALRQRTLVALESMMDVRISGFVSRTTPTPRLDAYREFLIGEDLHWRGDMLGALPHFERAGQLDSSFLLAAARMAVTAASAGRCDVVDSIANATAGRLAALSEMERPTIFASVARCREDWGEVIRLARERLALQPHSPLFRWILASVLRRANRPAEAAAILTDFDAEHDVGWLVPPRTLFFWRELTGAQHAIGDYTDEWKSADLFARTDPGLVMAHFYKARSFAGRNDARAAVKMVDSIEALAPAPIITGKRMRPIRAATTGWAMYGVSEELLAHGHPAEAQSVAQRTIKWVAGRTEEEKREPEYRLMLARAHLMTGEYEEAHRLLADLVTQDSTNIEYRAALGRVAALRGDTATARRIASSLVTTPGQRGIAARILGRAQIAAALGDKARTLSLLESLPYHAHPTDFLLFHSDPAFVTLHDNPRFEAFIRPRG